MIIDGKGLAARIYEDLRIKISKLGKKPSLAAVLVGDNPASISYISQKKKFAEYVGMNFELIELPSGISQEEMQLIIEDLNFNENISGYIVQLPLPKELDAQVILSRIDPTKDVDGFTKENIGKLFLGVENGLYSCTPKGIKKLLDEYNIGLVGKNVTIIGRSNIVGKPLALLFINHGATVTVCNSKTPDLKEHTLKSDIIVSAVGIPKLITRDMVKPGSVIIDVGFNRVGGKIVGDCDFENLKDDHLITPVPGGVGPMTVAMLIENTYLAHMKNFHE